MKTLGVLATDRRDSTTFYDALVADAIAGGVVVKKVVDGVVVNEVHYKVQKDQDHPPAIICGLRPDNTEEINQNYRLLKALGAKVIVSADKLNEEELKEKQALLGEDVKIISINPDESAEDFRVRVLQELYDDPKEEHKVNEGFKNIPDNKEEQDGDLKKLIEYAQSKSAIGTVGGAGVVAGSFFFRKLADSNTNFIAISNTQAPDKNNYLSGVGGSISFIDSYLQNVITLKYLTIGLAFPCNTAHIAKAEFCQDHLRVGDDQFAKLVDIGEATLESIRRHRAYSLENRVIFFGTPATMRHENGSYTSDKIAEANSKFDLNIVGIRLDPKDLDDEIKIRERGNIFDKTQIWLNEDELNKHFENLYDHWLTEIYYAIYLVKGFRTQKAIDEYREGKIDCQDNSDVSYEEAKKLAHDKILKVVREIRELYGDKENKISVALVCTELPVVFTDHELRIYNLISSTESHVEACQDRAEKDHQRRMSANYERSGADHISGPYPGYAGSVTSMASSSANSGEVTIESLKNKYSISAFESKEKKGKVLRISFQSTPGENLSKMSDDMRNLASLLTGIDEIDELIHIVIKKGGRQYFSIREAHINAESYKKLRENYVANIGSIGTLEIEQKTEPKTEPKTELEPDKEQAVTALSSSSLPNIGGSGEYESREPDQSVAATSSKAFITKEGESKGI